jgi:hypothetical protein
MRGKTKKTKKKTQLLIDVPKFGLGFDKQANLESPGR